MSRSPLEHARHNARTCEYLNQDGDFNDWVVTTAFYAALHYVEVEIFPFAPGDTTYQSFEEYCKENPSREGKHKRRSTLVYRHLITIHGEYDWLKNQSWTARYNEYQTSDRVKNTAIRHLQSIQSICDPEGSDSASAISTS